MCSNRVDGPAPPALRQAFYVGITKPRELAHDSRLYSAYMKAAERLAERGEPVRRVVLEEELKREYQRFLQAQNRERRERGETPEGRAEAVARWAQEHELPYDDGHVQFPDARIEYEDRDGRRAVENIEVVTPHYRGAHAAAKVGPDSPAIGLSAPAWEASGQPDEAGAASTRGLPRSCCRDDCRASPGGGEKGFTDRQAGFLVTVMLHSGVCVGRQYCVYARIVRGQKIYNFFASLVAKRLATSYAAAHRRAHIYHVTASSCMPRLESRTTATASPLRWPAP